MNSVFVYGTLRRGQGNHRLLENQEYIGATHTKETYTMVHLGGFPGVIKEGTTNIIGELYNVSDEVFARLDVLEGHPHFYTREEINIVSTKDKSWMYFYNMRGENEEPLIIETGDWLSVVEGRDGGILWGH